MGKPGGIVVASGGISGLASRISGTVVLKSGSQSRERVAGLGNVVDEFAGLEVWASRYRRWAARWLSDCR